MMEPIRTEVVTQKIADERMKLLPMMTDAAPTTMVPMPMPTSAKPWYWAMSAPENAAKPLAKARAIMVIPWVSTPKLRIMRALSPVARMAMPSSVARNQSRKTFTATATASKKKRDRYGWEKPQSPSWVNSVGSRSKGTLDRPIMRRFREYKAV